MKDNPRAIDVCCGGRMFWFDKTNPDVLFVDKRRVAPVKVGEGKNGRMFSCQPDRVMDFRNLDVRSGTYSLVVFDPPHFTSLGETSYMARKYGRLEQETWRDDIAKGFNECFRVLKKDGVLIFKWNEYDIPLSEVLKLSPYPPPVRSSVRQDATHSLGRVYEAKGVTAKPPPYGARVLGSALRPQS